MNKKNFEDMQYDYYSNTSSYVRLILEMMPESRVSIQMKETIKELYNYFLNHFDEDKIKEIATISSLFREQISLSSLEDTAKFVDYIYSNFIENIVFDSINRDEMFRIMNDNMKVYAGYYSRYRMDERELSTEGKRYIR